MVLKLGANYDGLIWVKEELAQSLEISLQSIQVYIESPEDSSPISTCLTQLEQVLGVLRMLNLRGAELLTEETLISLNTLREPNTETTTTLSDSILKALLVLSNYIELIGAEFKDHPIRIYETLNELRSARNQSLLSAPELVEIDPTVILPAEIVAPSHREIVKGLTPNKANNAFQILFLRWIKTNDLDSLKKLYRVIQYLHQASSHSQSVLLWVLAENVIESLIAGSLLITNSIKITLGKLNQPVKIFTKQSEDALIENYPSHLLRELILLIAKSSSISDRSIALKNLFQADFYNQKQYNKIYNFGENALSEATQAVIEQIQQTKLQIDQLDRNSNISTSSIEAIANDFETIANTLDLLSETEVARLIRQQITLVNELTQPDCHQEEQILAIANALLRAENRLQPSNTEDDESEENLQNTVIKECLNELITIKEALTQHSTNNYSSHNLSETQNQLSLIAGSMMMLNLSQVTSVLENTAGFISSQELIEQPEKMSLIADVLTGIEFYLEGIIEHGGKRNELLITAQKQLDLLVSTSPLEIQKIISDSTSQSETNELQSTLSALDLAEQTPNQELISTTELQLNEENSDPDLTLVPLELESISKSKEPEAEQFESNVEESPAPPLELSLEPISLESTSQDKTSVQRYIDAKNTTSHLSLELIESSDESNDIAQETSVEKYINNLNNQSNAPLEVSPIELALTRHALSHSQDLTSVQRYINAIDDTSRAAPEQSITDNFEESSDSNSKFIQTLHSYVNNRKSIEVSNQSSDDATPLSITDLADSEQTLTVDDTVQSQFAEGIDNEIAEIFIEEADEVLSELSTLIPEWSSSSTFEPLETIRRHFHTLKGSGRMAGATTIGELAWSIESVLNTLIERGSLAPPELTRLVQESYELIPSLVTRFSQGEMESTPVVDALITRANNIDINDEKISEEQELQEIFNVEAAQHVASLNNAFANPDIAFKVSKDLIRAAHSLKGCANIAQAAPVGIISAELERTLAAIYESDIELDAYKQSVLKNAVSDIIQLIAHHNDNSQFEPDIRITSNNLETIRPLESLEKNIDPEFLAVLLEETDELLELYSQHVAQLKIDPNNVDYQNALKHTLSLLAQSANDAKLPSLSEVYTLLDQFLTSSLSAPDNIDFTLFDLGYEHAMTQIEVAMQNQAAPDISEFKTRVDNTINPIQTATQTELNNFYPDPEYTQADRSEGDSELVNAFIEELSELLESSGRSITQWTSDPFDLNASMQLQRDLHTIKGGARLTEITPIADLSHQTESLVLFSLEENQPSSSEFFNLLQRCQDNLADMLDMLLTNQPLKIANNLLADIDSYCNLTNEQQETLAAEPSFPDKLAQSPAAAESMPKGLKDEVESTAVNTHVEHVRVRADLLDYLTNFAGEVNISRDRVSQQNMAIQQQLGEMEATIERLQDQLRNLEIETETQILFRYEHESDDKRSDFDPLELDRFSMIQQLSRGLTESVSDLNDINSSLTNLVRDSDTILLQQSRLSTGIHQSLMNTRLLPFKDLISRLERIVRQTNLSTNKQCELRVFGADHELDRTMLDKLIAPIEHIVRNAIAHGIETPEQRLAAGKNQSGQLTLTISRDGSEILISLSDDGQGINVDKIREKALSKKLIRSDRIPSDETLVKLILTSGFSTADDISQLSGRGVGMDVVNNEIRALKGRLSIQSQKGQGTTFNIRLPLSLSIMQALLVSTSQQQFAIPLASVDTVERVPVDTIQALAHKHGQAYYELNGMSYEFYSLAELLDLPLTLPEAHSEKAPLLLFRYGDKQIALLVDSINSNREIVIKSAGPQLSQIPAINGATILGDGQVVFVLDVHALIDNSAQTPPLNNEPETTPSVTDRDELVAMVVDDSITMRKASGNLLRRYGFEVITAKDGIDAIAQLHDILPDIILLDVEMPRMDGFEFATFVRNDPFAKNIPIIMITSRTGDKHRTRANNIGVNDYMGKPYQEHELISSVQTLLGDRVELVKE